MKTRKRLLSLFLALCIAITAMSVGFYAIAAQQSEQKDAAVTQLETGIKDWYDTQSKYLYSTKEEEAEQKAAAQKAMDGINAKLKKLTDSQKLSMDVSYYAYWMNVVQDNIARTDSGKTSSPSTAERQAVLEQKLDRIEGMMGTLPADYKTTLNAMKAFGVKADGENYLTASSCNYKNAEAAKVLLNFLDAYKALNEKATAFADYIYLSSGYFVYATPGNDKSGSLLNDLCSYVFYYQQDVTEGSTGSNAPYVSSYDFISRSGWGSSATYSWKSGQDGNTYIAGYNKYLADTKACTVKPGENALNQILTVLDAKAMYKGVKEAVTAATQIGLAIKNNGTAALKDIQAAVAKVDALSGPAKTAYNKIMNSGNIKLYADLENAYTDGDALTPQQAYSNSTRLVTYTGADLYKLATDMLEELKLEDFVAYVKGFDLSKKAEKDIADGTERYNALNSDFKKKVDDATLTKFAQIVKPLADSDNFAKEVKNFKPTTIVRPKDSQVAMTKGGIQSAVDNLWSLVATVVVPMVTDKVDLTNGLDSVLEDNVYTIGTINAIFDLYANLSHNETATGVSLAPTIGKVIQLLISPSKFADMLDESKYASVVEKINKNCTVSSEEEAQGINELDKLAAIEFTAADFGFKDGDRDGFENALLAALRPITTLLRDENGLVGIAGLKFHMFDYLDSDGNYVDGLYARLIPLLEQLGLTSLPTAEEYKANFEAVRDNTGSKDIASDEFLRPVLDALLKDIVDVVSPDPLNGLIQVLPRIAYIIDQDMLTTTLKDIAKSTGKLLTGLTENLDLSGDFFNNLLTKDPIDLTDLVGQECKLQLKAIDWGKLANCCTVKSVASHSNHNKYFVLRTGETDTAFTTAFYYVYDVAFADKANYSTLKAVITKLMGDTADSVIPITDKFVSIGKVATYGQVLDLLGTPGDEPIEPGNNNKPGDNTKPGNNKPGNNNGNKPNGNNNIPKNDGNKKNDKTKASVAKNNIPKNNRGSWKSPSTGACVFGGAALLAIGGALMIMCFRRKDDAVTE